MALRRSIPALALIVLLAPALLQAQESRGTIAGKIMDPTGAVVPGAMVRITNVDTNVTLPGRTNESGNYQFPLLSPGQYRIVADQAGFKRFVHENVRLSVGERLLVDINLELGGTNESVTVTAETTGIETGDATVGRVFQSERIQNLPIMDGNVYKLVLMTPGVTFLGSLKNTEPFYIWDNASIGVNGTEIHRTEFSMDGVPNMRKGVGAFSPSRDMVQEFKVETATYQASAGHGAGGQINVSLKSGTNRLHGSAREEVRNPALNANDFFANRAGQPKPDYTHDHFGGSFGGPVYFPKLYDGRNKTFFFYGYEGVRMGIPSSFTGTVATAKMRQGDFSELLALGSQYQVYDPGTIAIAAGGRFSRQLFPGNVIPPSRLSPVAKKYLEYWPQPNQVGTVDFRNNFYRALLSRNLWDSHMGKVDQQFSDKHRFSARVNISNRMEPNEDLYKADGIANKNRFPVLMRGGGLHDIITLSPTVLVTFKYGFTRVIEPGYPNSLGLDLTSLGFPSYWAGRFTKDMRWMPRVTIAGYSGFGDSQYSNWATYTHAFSGDVAKAYRNHSLKAGFDIRVMRENRYQTGNMMGYFDFGAGWTRGPLDNSAAAPIGQGLASFLLGLPTGGEASQNASFASQSIFRAGFLDDTWRLTRKLTLTLGLRWELEGPWTERFNRGIRGYDFSSVSPLQDKAAAAYRTNPIPEIPVDQFRLMGGLTFLGVGNPRQQINADSNNFAPRVGLAWRIGSRTVVRSGYGVFYDLRNFTIIQNGFSMSTAFVASADQGLHFTASLSDPFPAGLVDPPGAKLGLVTAAGQSVSFLDPAQAPNPYMQRWSLGVQHELPSRVLVDVGYVGNRGTHTGIGQSFNFVPRQYWSTLPVRDQATINFLSANVANPFQDLLPGTARNGPFIARSDLLVRYPQFSAVNLNNQPIGFTWYHSLQTRVEKRTTRGASAGLSWTWSKLMQATGRLNPFDDQLEHVIANIDRTHRLSLDWIYELPVGRGKRYGHALHPVLQQFLGGWRVAGIYSAQSGIADGLADVPFTGPFQATDLLLPENQRGPDHYYNTNINLNRDPRQAFVWHVRTLSTRFGAVRTDGLNVWDISLAKDFALREAMKLKFEGQFLNAFNHPVFAAPVGSPTNSDFGKITSQLNLPRNIQLTLRFVF